MAKAQAPRLRRFAPRTTYSVEKVLERVDKADNGCWLWNGPINKDGHPVARCRREIAHLEFVHRYMYEMHIAPLGKYVQVRHTCGDQLCINPAHLDTVDSLTAFMACVSKQDNGCWLWTGLMSRQGYGFASLNGKRIGAHRAAYMLLVGPIPTGLDLDHLCRHRACVNPDHLEAVTHRINILRGEGLAAKNALKTHCKRGHEFTPDNILRDKQRTHVRRCKICVYAYQRAARA